MVVDSVNPRVCRAPDIATEMLSSGKAVTILTPAEIRDMAKKNPESLIVVFGSLYMLAEFLDH